MRVELTPDAHIDIAEAMEYYSDKGGLTVASDFYSEFWSTAKRIEQNAYSFPIYIKNYRRVQLHRFPYNILFRIVDEQTLRILTVRHDKRHSSYGTERI